MWTEHANVNVQFEIQHAELFMDIMSSLNEPSCANFTLALEYKDARGGSIKMKKKDSHCQTRLHIRITWGAFKISTFKHRLNQLNQISGVGTMSQHFCFQCVATTENQWIRRESLPGSINLKIRTMQRQTGKKSQKAGSTS